MKQRRLQEIASPFLCCSVNRECLWTKMQIEKKKKPGNAEKFCFRHAGTWKIALKHLRLTSYCFIKLGVLETLFSAFVFSSYHTEFRLTTTRHKPESERMISHTTCTLHNLIPYLFSIRWYPSEIKLMVQKLLIVFRYKYQQYYCSILLLKGPLGWDSYLTDELRYHSESGS